MKGIYKYPLQITDEQIIKISYNGKVLKVAEQEGQLFIWVIFDNKYDNETSEINVRVIGTGHWMEDTPDQDWVFLDTVVMSNGLVWHIFIED